MMVKIVTTVPETHADLIREVAGNAGAGALGKYMNASFSTKGVGRFLPTDGAKPAIGSVGTQEDVFEERIEWTCSRDVAQAVVNAIRTAHPYEEPVIDVYPLESL